MARSQEGPDIGSLDALEADARSQSALHDDGIERRVGTEVVKSGDTVEIPLRRADRTGELVVEKATAVIEPLGVGVFRAGYPVGQVLPVGNPHDMQDRILAAILGETVDEPGAVRRGAPPVERDVPGAGELSQCGRVDQCADLPVLAHEQFEVVRAERPLLEKQLCAGALYFTGRDGVAG